jgi:hypothetical protein
MCVIRTLLQFIESYLPEFGIDEWIFRMLVDILLPFLFMKWIIIYFDMCISEYVYKLHLVLRELWWTQVLVVWTEGVDNRFMDFHANALSVTADFGMLLCQKSLQCLIAIIVQ